MGDPLGVIARLGVVPVVVIDRVEDAGPLGEALLQAGLPCAEITFRTAAAESAIGRLANLFPEILTGAGTVLSPAQAEAAVASGARFIVAPGFDPAVVAWCAEAGVPVIPGAVTATEVTTALRHGVGLVKFFPAEAAGGVEALEALAGPFPEVRFFPTGGIDASNLAAYLRLPSVAACGGSWLASRSLVRRGAFNEIADAAAAAVAIVADVRAAG